MDREVAPAREVREHPVGDPPETDLECRAVVDEPGDVARDLLRHVLGRRVEVLDDRRVDLDEAVDAVGGDPAVSARPWHRGVDLREDRAGRERCGFRDVHRDPEAARAVRIGRSDLDQRDVEPEPTAA